MTAEHTYLDYNASAPLRPAARDAMVAALDNFGNPSSVHADGRRARGLVEAAREEVAALVNARPSEVVFTSGATEANNWALSQGWQVIALSGIEHDSVRVPSVLSGARLLEIAATGDGVAAVETIDLSALVSDKGPRGTLIALQMANNETGAIQPVAEAVALAETHGAIVHTDAVQTAGRTPIDFAALGVAMMSLSSHKIGGPKGAGALVIRDGISLRPFIAGGGQERRRRAGTENVAAIAGFGAAAREAAREVAEMNRVKALRDRLEEGILRATPEARIMAGKAERLANTSCIAWPGKRAETLVIKLDLAGIAVSAGAACSSGKVGQSHVLAAMGLSPEIASSAIRVSIGAATTEKDIAAFLAAWQSMRGDTQIAA
jgi:cysteine desulfurase